MSETQETEVVEEAVVVDEPAAEAVEVAAEEPAAEAATPAGQLQGRVYVCERGHRVATLWSTPETCRARATRNVECGRPLYHINDLPEQVQKALNPLKASKKASKK